MSPYYEQAGWQDRRREDLAGALVLLACALIAICWYVAITRLHLHNDQCLEILIYLAIAFLASGLILAHLVGRRRKREANWPHPAIWISSTKDSKVLLNANQTGATLLGYNVHKEPWFWPDAVRMKHGVIVGGTGAGKSTFLENIIAQDLTRHFGARRMPMIIFDGKGERDFLGRLDSMPAVSTQKRLNFEMSAKMLERSLADRERIEKIQGLLNELLSFLEDELSIVTGSYQDLLTLDDVLEKDLILFVSLNANRNQRAVEALGKILLQNIQLMVGKRYAQAAGERDRDEPMLSVILDEFAPFAYPGFTQVLQTARGARVSFLFSFQSLPQLQRVSQSFADEVSSAPGTKMIMNVSEEHTAQWFLKASARFAAKRRSLSVRRTGLFAPQYTETGTGSESDVKETRAREDHIKNLPVGQMEILMVDNREGTLHSHLHVRQAPRFQLPGLTPSLYPRMQSYLDHRVGVNLRFKENQNRRQRRRRSAGLSLDAFMGN